MLTWHEVGLCVVETEDLSKKDIFGQRPGWSMRQAMKLHWAGGGEEEGHQIEEMRL